MERKLTLPPFPFPSDTAGYREAIEARLQSGDIDPDVARAVLEELDKRPPPKSPLERRIVELELILASPVLGEHAGNAAAVLEGYKAGTLEYLSGQYYIFKEGKRVAGPRPLAEFDPKEVLFGEFPNPRGIWIESRTIWLDAAFAPVTPYGYFLFPISFNELRLGAPLLRSVITQGTLPDGEARIAAAVTRTGLADLLREHANYFRRYRIRENRKMYVVDRKK